MLQSPEYKTVPLVSEPLSTSGIARCVFIDRDGVINSRIKNGYVKSWSEFLFRPEAFSALADLSGHGIPVVIVTNQRGIALGQVSVAGFYDIMERMVKNLSERGVKVAGWLCCPHDVLEGCYCRKPLPGMLLTAASQLGIDCSRSYMIGDKLSDLQAGNNAGCRRSFLIDEDDPSSLTQAVRAVLRDLEACDGKK